MYQIKITELGIIESPLFTIPDNRKEMVSTLLQSKGIDICLYDSGWHDGMSKLYGDKEQKEIIRILLQSIGGTNTEQSGHFPFGID